MESHVDRLPAQSVEARGPGQSGGWGWGQRCSRYLSTGACTHCKRADSAATCCYRTTWYKSLKTADRPSALVSREIVKIDPWCHVSEYCVHHTDRRACGVSLLVAARPRLLDRVRNGGVLWKLSSVVRWNGWSTFHARCEIIFEPTVDRLDVYYQIYSSCVLMLFAPSTASQRATYTRRFVTA